MPEDYFHLPTTSPVFEVLESEGRLQLRFFIRTFTLANGVKTNLPVANWLLGWFGTNKEGSGLEVNNVVTFRSTRTKASFYKLGLSNQSKPGSSICTHPIEGFTRVHCKIGASCVCLCVSTVPTVEASRSCQISYLLKVWCKQPSHEKETHMNSHVFLEKMAGSYQKSCCFFLRI